MNAANICLFSKIDRWTANFSVSKNVCFDIIYTIDMLEQKQMLTLDRFFFFEYPPLENTVFVKVTACLFYIYVILLIFYK